jgi:phage shock protein C
MDERAHGRGRLYRSNNGLIFGVCGGIAEHFDLPAWAVRLICAILMLLLLPPAGLVIYVVLGFILPKRPAHSPAGGPDEAFWDECGAFSTEALQRLQKRFEAIDRRLQRMESIVTKPGFGLEDEISHL